MAVRVFVLFHDYTTSRDCPVASPIHNELTPPWESWQPSSFKVTNKAMVSVGGTFASCCSGFGNPSEREGSKAREKFMVAVTASIPCRHPPALSPQLYNNFSVN